MLGVPPIRIFTFYITYVQYSSHTRGTQLMFRSITDVSIIVRSPPPKIKINIKIKKHMLSANSLYVTVVMVVTHNLIGVF